MDRFTTQLIALVMLVSSLLAIPVTFVLGDSPYPVVILPVVMAVYSGYRIWRP